MQKIVIVDDEFLMRIGIKSSVEWEKYGYEIVGQAEDGIQALTIIRDTLPDIVLTDIKMPNMDGVELIKNIKKEFPYIKIIVLSCYGELDYVKAAIKSGAEDYILKLSMQPSMLLDVLNKTRNAIEFEKKADEETVNLKDEIRVNKYLIKENLYRRLVHSSITEDEFEKRMRGIGCAVDFSKCMIICCSIDDFANAPQKSRMRDQYLLKFAIINIIEEITQVFYKGDVVEIDNGKYIIVIEEYKKYENGTRGKKIAFDFCQKLNSAVNNCLNISVSFGCLIETLISDDFRSRFIKACKALEHKFYLGKGSLSFFDEICEFVDEKIIFSHGEELIVTSFLDRFDLDGAKYEIHLFFERLSKSAVYAPSNIRQVSIDILHSLIQTIKKLDEKSEFLTSNYKSNPVDMIMNAETLTDIKEWFDNYLDKLFDYLINVSANVKRPEIKNIIRYVTENINEDISLEKAARISNISKCYFSTVFKRATGESFTDFTNRVKMEKAKELLQKYDLRIYEVAEKVGINDESYFSKLFKKYTGQNASKIKKDIG